MESRRRASIAGGLIVIGPILADIALLVPFLGLVVSGDGIAVDRGRSPVPGAAARARWPGNTAAVRSGWRQDSFARPDDAHLPPLCTDRRAGSADPPDSPRPTRDDQAACDARPSPRVLTDSSLAIGRSVSVMI